METRSSLRAARVAVAHVARDSLARASRFTRAAVTFHALLGWPYQAVGLGLVARDLSYLFCHIVNVGESIQLTSAHMRFITGLFVNCGLGSNKTQLQDNKTKSDGNKKQKPPSKAQGGGNK